MQKYFVVAAAALLLLACSKPDDAGEDPSFTSDVLPVFTANCAQCHGPDVQNGNYRLDSRAEALGVGSDTVPNVIPGKADSSLIYQRIRSGAMPPASPLPDAKQQIVKNWIDKGAKDN